MFEKVFLYEASAVRAVYRLLPYTRLFDSFYRKDAIDFVRKEKRKNRYSREGKRYTSGNRLKYSTYLGMRIGSKRLSDRFLQSDKFNHNQILLDIRITFLTHSLTRS